MGCTVYGILGASQLYGGNWGLGTGNRELSYTWSAVVMFFSDLKGVFYSVGSLLPNALLSCMVAYDDVKG